MKFYGLHWIADDGTPLQVIIETRTLHVWARSCPRGGEWTKWRRLDAERNEDGTLKETCEKALHAEMADTAGRLATSMGIRLSGAVTGYGVADGAGAIEIVTSMAGGGETEQSIQSLSARVAALEAQGDAGARLDKLEKRQGNLISAMQSIYYNSGLWNEPQIFNPDA